jgi:hypothetical protein
LTLETLNLGDAQNVVWVGFSGNLFQWITSFDCKQHHQTTISRCTRWRISALGAGPGQTNRRCFILNLDSLDYGNTSRFAPLDLRICSNNIAYQAETATSTRTPEIKSMGLPNSSSSANGGQTPPIALPKSALIAIILAPVTLIVTAPIFAVIFFYYRGKAYKRK